MPLVVAETEPGQQRQWFTAEAPPPSCTGGLGKVVILTASQQPHEETAKLHANEPLSELQVRAAKNKHVLREFAGIGGLHQPKSYKNIRSSAP